MDTTSSTVGGGEEPPRTKYVSCIKIDGVPILPPLMNEARRREMRSYKEQAILKEKELREKRLAKPKTARTMPTVTKFEGAVGPSPQLSPVESRPMTSKLHRQGQGRSSSTSPVAGGEAPATSTPRVARVYTSSSIPLSSSKVTAVDGGRDAKLATGRSDAVSSMTRVSATSNNSSSDIPVGVLRERKIEVVPLDLNKSGSSDPSGGGTSSVASYDGDEEKESVDSDNNASDDNVASAASSAGTFIIRKSNESNSGGTPLPKEDQMASSEDEPESENALAPLTVLRQPNPSAQVKREVSFKRKRPAKYFDDDEDGKNSHKSVEYCNIPNSVAEEEEQRSSDSKRSAPVLGSPLSFSSIAHTNFSMLANSLTKEFSQKFCSNLSTPSTSATAVAAPNTNTSIKRSSDGSYNVTLSKDIPSSAEENPNKSDSSDELSNSSDKENRDMTGDSSGSRHMRKLSYTLATPSAALLEAASRDQNFTQRLETIASEAGSIGVPSVNPTPVKSETVVTEKPIALPFSLGSRPSATVKRSPVGASVSNLNLDQGKQAHLERFLGEQEDQAQSVEVLLRKMQLDHESKLQQLSEQHRLQELRIKQEFESEFEKLKEKISSTFNTTTDSSKSLKSSPTSLLDSPSSARSPRPATGNSVQLSGADNSTLNSYSQKIITSGMSCISERTRSATSIYTFTGGLAGGMSSNMAGGASADLAGVGLSKLQSRMQMMSPAFFRTPADAKSPLLKGLVYPDPLDKPQPPIRIPPKALEASMKVKFDKLSAAVKGYLTRRLLNTEKVLSIVQTVQDTVALILKLYEEGPMAGTVQSVKPQDSELHQRLVQQLTGACRSFHDVFFKLSTKERMAVIATDREKQRAKALRAATSPTKPAISNATLKSIERRMSTSARTSPKREHRKSRVSKAYEDGSHSVKPKPIKSFNVSPKRRRISYWDDGRGLTRSTAFASQQDLNGNNFKAPMSSARSQASISTSSSARSTGAMNQMPMSSALGNTFIVSAGARGYGNSGNGKSNQNQVSSGLYRRESIGKSVPGSSRSSQAPVAPVMSSSVGLGRPKGSSSSRQPWNAVRH